MRTKVFRMVVLVLCLAFAGSAIAQEGHPLKGTWRGDWGPSANDRNHVVMVLDYDGKALTGIVNPGPNALPIKTITLNPADWSVNIVVDAKDARGQALTYTINGKIENLGIPGRSLVGTWNHGNVRGDFRLSRQ